MNGLSAKGLDETKDDKNYEQNDTQSYSGSFKQFAVVMDPLVNGAAQDSIMTVNYRLVLTSHTGGLGIFTGIAFAALFSSFSHEYILARYEKIHIPSSIFMKLMLYF